MNIDQTAGSGVNPADDFFRYVNGKWMAENPIPADEASWGSFYTLRLDVEKQLHAILEEIAANSAGDKEGDIDKQKVSRFYKSAIDVEKRNRLGIEPLAYFFSKIDAIATPTDLVRVLGELHRSGASGLWATFVEQDEKQSDVMALHFWQGGLGLPDRDYYVNDDEKSKKIRADYLEYVAYMMSRIDSPGDASSVAAGIMEIETQLAKAALSRVELRDVEKMYNKLTIADLAALAPHVSFNEYLMSIGFGGNASSRAPAYIIVGQPAFFTEINRLIAETPLAALKTYLRWHILNDFASYLSEDLERHSFDFYGRTFSGATEMKPLWRRALGATNGALDELLGKLYVAKHFPPEARAKVKNLVEYLVVAYRARIDKLDWMGAETKQKAFEKLAAFTKKLGYPDVWKDFASLAISTDASFAENAAATHRFEFDRKIREVGGPVNREEWLMSPQTVNAYYMPPMNDIVFPAAILQPPFFDPAADDATNFGGIGSVIGHELTHGFDDQGSHFDAHGNINEWWTSEDRARFNAKAAHLAEQFDAYEPLPGLHVNGKLTLGENIADLGGLVVAYDALKLWLKEKSNELSKEDARRFFIGYAVTERGNIREERLRVQIQTDPHSPSEFRVNGPASNMSEFYQAFDVKHGDKLWREPGDRVEIW